MRLSGWTDGSSGPADLPLACIRLYVAPWWPMLSGQGRDGPLEVAAVDNTCHEQPRLGIDPHRRVDRAVQDAVVADPQPMPGRSTREGLDVEVGLASCQGRQRRADLRETLPRTDAPEIALSSP